MTRNDINNLHPLHPLHRRYIELNGDLPVLQALEDHSRLFTVNDIEKLGQLRLQTYAEGKWTVADVLQHLVDTERILSYRALCIARNDQTPLPGFDEETYAAHTNAANRSIADILHEFKLVRETTVLQFGQFDNEMLSRTGLCSGIKISALALGFVIAGHALHHENVLRERYFGLTDPEIEIVADREEYFPLFASLNRAWIQKYFTLEPDDIYVLDHPRQAILDPGGAILFARRGAQIIGTVALQPAVPGEYEMIKMAVDEQHRRQGAGKHLIHAAVNQAKIMGANRLILHSNTELNAQAISLYRQAGFREIPLGDCRYKRANIKMELNLNL